MKNPYSAAGHAVSFFDWLEHPASAFSLVIGATCGCDVSRLGRVVCSHLNEAVSPSVGYYRAFGPDDIRQLAGDPRSRHAIFDAAARTGIELPSGCDYECMVRAIAALGGAVLCGEWAFEKCADTDQVLRMAVSRCDQCSPGPSIKLDPEGYSTDGLARTIAERFQRWSQKRENDHKSRNSMSLALPILL
jgi:hypothetical protein